MKKAQTILHTSDLHIQGPAGKENYSIHVWKTILQVAQERKVSAILLSGDVFDSFEDLKEMRKEFLKYIRTDSVEAIYHGMVFAIPGNHEFLRKQEQESFSTFDLRPMEWVHENNFSHFTFGTWELIAIPYNTDYVNYPKWDIPKKEKPRVVMAHGSIPEAMDYTGPSEEEGRHILELDLIRRMEPDYVALGHIHKSTKLDNLRLKGGYPGSPLVWRAKESGVRKVECIHIHDHGIIEVESVELPQVGQYRKFFLPFLNSFDSLENLLQELEKIPYSDKDYIDIEISGVSDKEREFNDHLNLLYERWKTKFRKLEWIPNNMIFLDNAHSNILMKKFLEKWEKLYKDALSSNNREQIAVLERARMIGLNCIKS